MNWIATVRRTSKDPNHDPKNKKTGHCDWSDYCTDVTGEHHSFILYGCTEEVARNLLGSKPGWRMTRLEQVSG
jgi:hypothetical protein